MSSSPFLISNRFCIAMPVVFTFQALETGAEDIITGSYPPSVRKCVLDLHDELLKAKAENETVNERAEFMRLRPNSRMSLL